MATIDLSRISYYVIAALNTGEQIHLENVAENIAWEENKSELSVRLNLTLRDVPYSGGRLSQKLALCTLIYLYADCGSGQQEVFRGEIYETEHSQINDDAIILTCYDMLYATKKSQDNKYYAKGKSTQGIIQDIFSSWNIAMGEYSAGSMTHEKTLYKNKAVSAMLTETMETARKTTGTKYVIRANKGKADVIKPGGNADIYAFSQATNLIASKDKFSKVNLVTRVLVVGKDDKEGRPKVEATINGQTEYGIYQSIKSRGSSSLADAKKEAQELIDEKGKPERTITLQSPDLPILRKGDKIHVTLDKLNGFFVVLGVSHNATSMTMQMEVEPA